MPAPGPGVPGFYHRVDKGQTLWCISKMYDVDIDEVIRVNNISDVTNIDVGQMLLIPGQQKVQMPQTKTPCYSEYFIWPLRGRVVANFGQVVNNMVNKGINIQPFSNGDVLACRSGRVVFHTNDFKGFGKTLIIDHGDGFATVYAGNSKVLVKSGDNVQKGDIIAKLDRSGSNEYLHFEVRKGYIPQNPYFYLPR